MALPAISKASPEAPKVTRAPLVPAANAQENPYIATLSERASGSDAGSKPASIHGQTPTPTIVEPRTGLEESRVVSPTLTAPEAPARLPDPAYRPPPARDKKYFPQQKRF